MKYSRKRKTVIGLVLMAVAVVLPAVVADVAGLAPHVSAQNATCGYSEPSNFYVFKGSDSRVRANLRVNPSTALVADTPGNLGQDVEVVTFSNRLSVVPAQAVDYCTVLTVRQVAGPPSAQRSFKIYNDGPPSDFTPRSLPLSAGTWKVTYTVTVGLAETFDGNIHVYEDTYSEELVVATPPCAAYESGPIAYSPGADLKILTGPGAAVSNDTFIATTPTDNDEEWVLDAKLYAASPSRRAVDMGDRCYTYTVTPRPGTAGTTRTIETASASAVGVTLAPGGWEIKLNVRTTIFDGAQRDITGSDTESRTIRVTVPIGLDPISEPLPAGLRISAQASGYHPSWGIAQTSWTNTLTLPQNKHWLRFRLQAKDRNGNQVALAAGDGSTSLKALVTTPSNRRYYLKHAAFADGDEAGYDFIQTNGVWNELTASGTYKISFWVSDGDRSFWSTPVKLTIR